MTKLATPPRIMADANTIFAMARRGRYETENFNTFACLITPLKTHPTPDATEWLARRLDNMTVASTFTVTRVAVLIDD